MASRSFLGEGSNINLPPSFVRECYDFWKIRMRIFIESQDLDIWNAIEEGPYTL
nr:transposon Pol polyprotein [Lupinus angustifolius]